MKSQEEGRSGPSDVHYIRSRRLGSLTFISSWDEHEAQVPFRPDPEGMVSTCRPVLKWNSSRAYIQLPGHWHCAIHRNMELCDPPAVLRDSGGDRN